MWRAGSGPTDPASSGHRPESEDEQPLSLGPHAAAPAGPAEGEPAVPRRPPVRLPRRRRGCPGHRPSRRVPPQSADPPVRPGREARCRIATRRPAPVAAARATSRRMALNPHCASEPRASRVPIATSECPDSSRATSGSSAARSVDRVDVHGGQNRRIEGQPDRPQRVAAALLGTGTGPPRSGARAGGSRCPQGGFLRLVGSSVEVVMPLCVAGVPLPIVWRRCALTVRPERQGPRAAGLPLDKLT